MNSLQAWQIENIATMLITGATIVGLYAFGAGGNAFWGLVLLANLNTLKVNKV